MRNFFAEMANTKGYVVYLTNFGYWLNSGIPYDTLEDAYKASEKACFETAIWTDGKHVASWGPISRRRTVVKVTAANGHIFDDEYIDRNGALA